MLISNGHPIESLDQVAREFTERIIEHKGKTYGDLELPKGVSIAIRDRMFRAVSDYDIVTDTVLLRVDLLMATA